MASGTSSWVSDVISLPSKFRKLVPTSSTNMLNAKQCVVLASLADLMVHNVDLWWNGVFHQELVAVNDEGIGSELFRVLNHGLQLVQLCAKQDWPNLGSAIVGGSGEFRETIENARRYSQMLNKLIKEGADAETTTLVENLRDKIERDCSLLQETLKFACKQDKRFFLEGLNTLSWSKMPKPMVAAFKPLLKNGSLPDKPNISYAHIEMSKEIGKGSYGLVRKAKWSGLPVAVKEFGNELNFDPEKKAVNNLLITDFPHVVQVYGHSKEEGKYYIVLELMDGDLEDLVDRRVHNNSPLEIIEAVDIMLQVSKGLEHLHRNDVVHRDLKPKNVLYKIQASKHLLIKITDFGSAKKFKTGQHTSRPGSKGFMAPELDHEQEEAHYSRKVDVYSFGILAYYILAGKKAEDLRKYLEKDNLPKLSETVPPPLHELLQRCCQTEATQRPHFAEICEKLWELKESILKDARGKFSTKNITNRNLFLFF